MSPIIIIFKCVVDLKLGRRVQYASSQSMYLDTNLEYILDLMNINGNTFHLKQGTRHAYDLVPAFIFRMWTLGNLGTYPCLTRLIQFHLKKKSNNSLPLIIGCNRQSVKIHGDLCHNTREVVPVANQATWEPLHHNIMTILTILVIAC